MNEVAFSFQDLARAAEPFHLAIFGVAQANPKDPVPPQTKSIILLGPKEPGFWPYITRQAEFLDKGPDPVDRWSRRVITRLADELDATPVLPFGGPPYSPFISWALASGSAWTSPVSLLVHASAGLFLSFRGALALPYAVQPPPPAKQPCNACSAQPCLTACPAGAIDQGGYDLDRCHDYLNTDAGQDCLTNGCAVRRACPVSKTYARLPEQSAHHMKAFHP
ncbi:MAG: ferredoxin [Paracoccaceae bacterium]